MAHARRSWLFADAVRFAEVTSRPPTRDNAAWLLPAALETLHYSPEPRVIERRSAQVRLGHRRIAEVGVAEVGVLKIGF